LYGHFDLYLLIRLKYQRLLIHLFVLDLSHFAAMPGRRIALNMGFGVVVARAVQELEALPKLIDHLKAKMKEAAKKLEI
jgi:hypothetical protein